ncbi:MAG: ABC transporter substrate-binding protein [Eubacteriales bacterium]
MKNLKKILLCGALSSMMMLSACASGGSSQETTSNETTVTPTTQETEQEETNTESDSQDTAENPAIVISNFGQELTYEQAPERVITLSYGPTEIMVALGLEDHMIAIAEADNTIDIVSEEHREVTSLLPIIAKAEDGGVPTLEVVLAETPDFVYGSSFGFNADYGVGAADDFLSNEINIYASASTYKEMATIEDTYEEILDMGKIFRVEERAQVLVDTMKADYDYIASAVAGVEPVTVMLYNSGTDSPYVYFESSFLSNLATAAGATNVVTGDGSAARITMEAVIEANPEYIVVMEDTWQPVEEKIAYFQSRPELADITAIKENNFVVISLEYSCFSSVHNIEAIEIMAKAFHPECFE